MSVQPETSEPKVLPIWLSIPIILLCLAGGGWMIHWYVKSDPIAHDVKVLADGPNVTVTSMRMGGGGGNWAAGGPGGPGGMGGGRNRQNNFLTAPPLNPTLNSTATPAPRLRGGTWELTSDLATLDADVKTDINMRVQYRRYTFLNSEVRSQLGSASLILKNPDRPDAAHLTDEQKARLKTLAGDPPMVISQADHDLLSSEANAYVHALAAEREQLQPKLLQDLEDVARRSMTATTELALKNAREISEILKASASASPASTPLN